MCRERPASGGFSRVRGQCFRSHRWVVQLPPQNGGDVDLVAEDLIAEVIAEDKAGQVVSHQPGRA